MSEHAAGLRADLKEIVQEQIEFRELLYQMTRRDLLLRYKQTIMGSLPAAPDGIRPPELPAANQLLEFSGGHRAEQLILTPKIPAVERPGALHTGSLLGRSRDRGQGERSYFFGETNRVRKNPR